MPDPTPTPVPAKGVLLLSLPFAGIDRPALGLSLFKAGLERRGVPCEVRYLTFAFADLVGLDDYLFVSDQLPYTAFVGDWLFTRALYGERPEADAAYVDEVLRGHWNLPPETVARVLAVREYCEPFVERCLEEIPWHRYGIVGFTSTFTQNLASLALARRLKETVPEIAIVFGGANWEGEMGRALHREFPFVDYAATGEADAAFPELVARLRAGADVGDVPGIVYRDRDGTSVATGPAAPVTDMDALPVPDFDDFHRQLGACGEASFLHPKTLIETSRGCWWGARSHCTFCGLNGATMAFRSKSADRVLAEISHLRRRYGSDEIEVVDNILDMRYFSTLLPRLAAEHPDLRLFYEVKANLRLDQLRLLRDAGIRVIQPGIESLSTAILRRMRKGTTALQNVQLLKWCRELGIRPEWNLLYGFPGEEPGEYRRMLGKVDAIAFLDPPGACGPVRLDRFSPYHSEAASHGVVRVRAMRPYASLYPFDEATLREIAYYFDFDHAAGRRPTSYAGELIARVDRWQKEAGGGELSMVERPGGRTILVDRRRGWPRRDAALSGWRSAVYRSCDQVRSAASLDKRASTLGALPGELETFLDGCCDAGWMLRDASSYLALAVRRPARLRSAGAPEELPAVAAPARSPAAVEGPHAGETW